MGTIVGNAFLGLMGGFLGVLVSGGFYEYIWGGGVVGVWLIRKSFLWMSDYFIFVPIIGGIIGGAASEKWWGPIGGGFFTTIVGFYLFVFLLGGGF